MWPWAHWAVGYLLYSLYVRRHEGRIPAGPAAIAVTVGTQIPDLIDKPLSWSLAVLPTGRSLAHSLLTATLVLVAVYVLARRFEQEPAAVAFGVGYLSHSLGDYLPAVLRGDPAYWQFLFWPVTRVPPDAYETEGSILGHFLAFDLSTSAILGIGLFAVGILAWVRDGRPGIGTVTAFTIRAVRE